MENSENFLFQSESVLSFLGKALWQAFLIWISHFSQHSTHNILGASISCEKPGFMYFGMIYKNGCHHLEWRIFPYPFADLT
jgi:hypothetical protein